MKVRFDRQAIQDLFEIRRYLIEKAGALAADRVREDIRRRIAMLTSRPLAGMATAEAGIRVMLPTHFPYRIYCTRGDTELVILHIRHTSREPPDLAKISR